MFYIKANPKKVIADTSYKHIFTISKELLIVEN